MWITRKEYSRICKTLENSKKLIDNLMRLSEKLKEEVLERDMQLLKLRYKKGREEMGYINMVNIIKEDSRKVVDSGIDHSSGYWRV